MLSPDPAVEGLGTPQYSATVLSVLLGTQSRTLQVEVSVLLDAPRYSVPDLAGEGLGTPRYSAPILSVVLGPPGYLVPDLAGAGLGTP